MHAGPQAAKHFKAQALYEKLFSSSPDAIIVINCPGDILDTNPLVETLFGYSRQSLLGKPIETLIPERFRSAHGQHRRNYIENPHTRPMGTSLELFGRRKDGSEFPADVMLSPVESEAEKFIICVIRDITERKKLEAEMKQLLLSDPLTGLGNSRRLEQAFVDETKRFQRGGKRFALFLLDLDGLKKINDTYGHEVGSRALCRVAEAIRVECRAIDTASRHGGDEFAVLLPETSFEGARRLANRIAARLEKDREEGPALSFCYGLAVYPQDGDSLHKLLAVADVALYSMKRLGHAGAAARGGVAK